MPKTTPEQKSAPPQMTPEEVEAAIASLRTLEGKSAKLGIQKGELIQKLKDGVPHGEFTSLLENQLGIPERTAQQLMSLARLKRDRLERGKSADFAGLGLSSLFELARPKVPPALIDQTIDEAAKQPPSFKAVKDRVDKALAEATAKPKAKAQPAKTTDWSVRTNPFKTVKTDAAKTDASKPTLTVVPSTETPEAAASTAPDPVAAILVQQDPPKSDDKDWTQDRASTEAILKDGLNQILARIDDKSPEYLQYLQDDMIDQLSRTYATAGELLLLDMLNFCRPQI